MEGSKETGMALLFGMVLVAIISLLVLFGCSTKEKVVTEYVSVHDTIRSCHVDTLHDVRVVIQKDTLRQVETHTFTVNQGGDTIREIHHHYDIQRTIVIDSTDRYRAVVDSLKAALKEERQKVKEVVKTKHMIRWWEWIVIIGIVAALVYGARLMRRN